MNNMNIMLKRGGGPFRKLIIMIPEGLGFDTNRNLTKVAANKWDMAGRPSDWLFCTCGKKEIHPDVTIEIIDNFNTNLHCDVTLRKEFSMMYCRLFELGVPEEQLVFESQSNNTYEQALYIKELFVQIAEEPLPQPCPVTVVCNDIHAPRVQGILNHTGWYSIDDDQVWTARYKRDYSNPLNHENWFHYLPRLLYQIAEAVITWRDRRKDLLPSC